MAKTSHLMTTAQAARHLGLSIRQVARLAETGELPHVAKAPGRRGAYLFNPEVIERFARERAARLRAQVEAMEDVR